MSESKRVESAGTWHSKSNTELLNEIDDILASSTAEDMDVDKVMENLERLQENAPVEQGYSREEAWGQLSDLLPATEKKPKKQRLQKLLRFAEIAAVVVVVLGVTASALGIEPLKPFQRLVKDIVQLSTPSGIMELPQESEAEYHSLREALDANGAEDAQCPTWIPEDYAFSFVSVRLSPLANKFLGYYSSTRGNIIINIESFSDNYGLFVESDEKSGFSSRVINDQEYYLTQNNDIVTAWWGSDQFSYEIHGTITEDEMESILKSIE